MSKAKRDDGSDGFQRITTDTAHGRLSWRHSNIPAARKAEIFWVAGVEWCAEAGSYEGRSGRFHCFPSDPYPRFSRERHLILLSSRLHFASPEHRESDALFDNRVCEIVRWLSFEPRRSCAAARDRNTKHDSGRDHWIRPMVAFGRAISNLLESLILAQDERWRRA